MPKLVELGSCSLHIVHGALSTGIKKSTWFLEKLLRSLFYLFEDPPAWREDFITITKTTTFPKPFCATRWLGDIPVAQRAIDIWSSITKYVVETMKKSKSKIPTFESFKVVSECVNDAFILAKLEFLVCIAKQLQPFLTKYQCDWPMMPFLARDLELVLRGLMSRFVKANVLQEASSATKLLAVGVSKSENLKLTRQVDVGFGATSALHTIPAVKFTEAKTLEFFTQCRDMLRAATEKIVERSPLKYSILRGMVTLAPRYIVSHPDSASTKFGRVLQRLDDLHWYSHAQCDTILGQYREVAATLHRDMMVDCESFNEAVTRLDTFYTDHDFHRKQQFAELWHVFLMLFTLSHGQASVERGFSVNKDVLAPNLTKESLVAQRFIHNALTSGGIKDVS